VAVSAAGIMNTICMAPPYVLYAMAQDGLFPRAFGRLHPRWQTPVLGVLGQGLWGALLLLLVHAITASNGSGATIDNLDFLCNGVVFVDWLFFTLCGCSLLVLRRRGGEAAFRAPGGRWLVLLFAVGAGAVTVGAIAVQWRPSVVGGAIVALGLPAFALFRVRRAPAG
jgi:APA family basic amino acid/polyamine antiporter